MTYLVEDIEILNDVVNITLKDDLKTYNYKVHAVAFANYYVTIGKRINNEFLSNLLEESKFYFMKDQIIKKLKIKDYSRGQIIEFLNDKMDEYMIDRMIKDLENNNYINDYNYLKNVFNKANSKLKGKLFIINYLKDKYIDEKLLASFFLNFDEKNLAEKLVKTELNKLKNKYPKQVIINKISYKLNYNGFSELIVQDIIDDLQYIKSNDNDDLIIKECTKLVNKYSKKLKNNELERKVIETLVAKGYNYKSVKSVIEGMIKND